MVWIAEKLLAVMDALRVQLISAEIKLEGWIVDRTCRVGEQQNGG